MTKVRRWRLGLWSALGTLIGALAIAAVIGVWVQNTSSVYVFERVAYFSDLMRVIRPVLILIVLLAWRPIATWLRERDMVSDRTHHRAIAIWPRLCIWSVLIEITLGQGYVLIGLAAATAYWAFLRFR